MLKSHRGTLPGPITVLLHDGTFYLKETLRLDGRDSGTARHPVIWRAAEGARPVISGGLPVTDWQQGPDGAWRAQVRPAHNFRQLFTRQSGEQQYTRRYRPTAGPFFVAGYVPGSTRHGEDFRWKHRNPQDRFIFHEGDIRNWDNQEQIEILIMHDWDTSRLQIQDIDLKSNTIRFKDFAAYRIGYWYKKGRNPYYVINAAENFGQPGQWYFDPEQEQLSLTPTRNMRREKMEAVAPQLDTLIVMKPRLWGTVEHIHFEGITFAHTSWQQLPAKYAYNEATSPAQGRVTLPSALEMASARNCEIRACRFLHLGGYAISLKENVHQTTIRNNVFADLGGGGIIIGSRSRQTAAWVIPSKNTVSNNVFRGIGMQHFSANAIWTGYSHYTRIEHNLIQQTMYCGIATGWRTPTPSHQARNTLVRYNHLQDTLMLLDHGGSIYTLGHQPGTRIERNLITKTTHSPLQPFRRRPPAAWAGTPIALDDDSSGFLVADNVAYNVAGSWEGGFAKRDNIRHYGNSLNIYPGQPGFPRAIAEQAGLEPAYRSLASSAPKIELPPLLLSVQASATME